MSLVEALEQARLQLECVLPAGTRSARALVLAHDAIASCIEAIKQNAEKSEETEANGE